MARRVRLETDLGRVRPHTLQVFEEFAARFDIHFAWGIGATGDHKAGKALDLMAYARGGGPDHPGDIRTGWNKKVADYAWANRKRLGLDYVIYDRLIQSNNPDGYAFGGWHDYTGESHANHVHLSFEERPPAYRPPTPPKPPAPAPAPKPKPEAPPMTADEMRKLLDYLLTTKHKALENADNPGSLWTLGSILRNIEDDQDRHTRQLNAIVGQLAELAAAVNAITTGGKSS